MKFAMLVAIVPEDLEQKAIDASRELGAGGITVMSARGISNSARKTFFGLTYDGSQSVLLMVLEKGLSMQVLKAISKLLKSEDNDSRGMVFTSGIDHLAGIDMSQVEKFEAHVRASNEN